VTLIPNPLIRLIIDYIGLTPCPMGQSGPGPIKRGVHGPESSVRRQQSVEKEERRRNRVWRKKRGGDTFVHVWKSRAKHIDMTSRVDGFDFVQVTASRWVASVALAALA
jgi:hypothetical protein